MSSERKRVESYVAPELFNEIEELRSRVGISRSAWIALAIQSYANRLRRSEDNRKERAKKSGRGLWPSGWPREVRCICPDNEIDHDPIANHQLGKVDALQWFDLASEHLSKTQRARYRQEIESRYEEEG